MKVNQAVKFDGITITLDNAKSTIGTYDLTKVVRRAALVIDGKSYQASKINATTLVIESELYVAKGDHDVELQLSVVNTNDDKMKAAVKKLVFKAIDKDSFGTANYTNGDETSFNKTSIAGTIRISDVNIAAKSITVKKAGPSEDVKFAQGNTDEVVVLAGEITNNESKALEINKFVVKVTSATTASVTKL